MMGVSRRDDAGQDARRAHVGVLVEALADFQAQAPIASHAQLQTALGLDAPTFEKIKHYVYLKQTEGAAPK